MKSVYRQWSPLLLIFELDIAAHLMSRFSLMCFFLVPLLSDSERKHNRICCRLLLARFVSPAIITLTELQGHSMNRGTNSRLSLRDPDPLSLQHYESQPLLPRIRREQRSFAVNRNADEVSTSCCISILHRDRVADLSMDKRFKYLVGGYVREQSESRICSDIIALCERYSIDSKRFSKITLMTQREYKRYIGEDCCGRNTFLRRKIREITSRGLCYCLCSLPGVVCALCAITWIKDIAALCISTIINCDDFISEEEHLQIFPWLSVTVWIYTAAIVDIVLSLLSALVICGIPTWVCIRLSFIPLYLSFNIIWVSIGFQISAEMDSSSVCNVVIMTWCIIQIVLLIPGIYTLCLACSRSFDSVLR